MHSRIGDVAAAQGRMGYALRNYQAGLAAIEPRSWPPIRAWRVQHDLFTLHYRLGTFLRERAVPPRRSIIFIRALPSAAALPRPTATI